MYPNPEGSLLGVCFNYLLLWGKKNLKTYLQWCTISNDSLGWVVFCSTWCHLRISHMATLNWDLGVTGKSRRLHPQVWHSRWGELEGLETGWDSVSLCRHSLFSGLAQALLEDGWILRKQRWTLQGILKSTQCNFYPCWWSKQVRRTSQRQEVGEINSAFWWEEWHAHTCPHMPTQCEITVIDASIKKQEERKQKYIGINRP